MTQPASSSPLLEIGGLRTTFKTEEGTVVAVRDVSLQIAPGRTLGLVGESGSGKSVTSLSILRLLPERAARIEAGRIVFEGTPAQLVDGTDTLTAQYLTGRRDAARSVTRRGAPDRRRDRHLATLRGQTRPDREPAIVD